MLVGLAAVLLLGVVLWLLHSNDVIYGLSAGSYVSEYDPSEIQFAFPPTESSSHGTFCYRSGETTIRQGSITIQNGYVVCVADPGGGTYRFEFPDNERIAYREKRPAPFYPSDGVTCFADGAAFRFVQQP